MARSPDPKLLLQKDHFPGGNSRGKRRSRQNRGSAGGLIVGISINARVASDIEIVGARIEDSEQSPRRQAEGRARLFHQLPTRRADGLVDGETPDGEARSRGHRVNERGVGSDNQGAGAATIHGSEGRAVYGSQYATAGVDIEPGNVAHGIRIRRRVACRYIRNIEEPATAIHYQGGRSRSRKDRRTRYLGKHAARRGTRRS